MPKEGNQGPRARDASGGAPGFASGFAQSPRDGDAWEGGYLGPDRCRQLDRGADLWGSRGSETPPPRLLGALELLRPDSMGSSVGQFHMDLDMDGAVG